MFDHTSFSAVRFSTSGRNLARILAAVSLVSVALFALSGCAASGVAVQPNAGAAIADAAMPASVNTVIEPLSAYQPPAAEEESDSPLPTPTATPEGGEPLRVTIATQGVRANLRSGPGTSFDIVAKVNPGQTFDVLGRSEDNRWYQLDSKVTGVNGDQIESGWVASELVRVAGEGEAPVVDAPAAAEALLSPDLSVQWAVDWSCNSDRCQIKNCEAEVAAVVNRQANGDFLPVEHTVTWDDACFSTDAWTFEVNQSTGEERTGEAEQNFLYSYWLGANPGDAVGVFPLGTGEGVEVFCSGPHSVEIEEGGGWTTVYEGNTCHDVATGMLVYMNYTKRWLFTGDYDGKTYARAFFGDSEKLEQRLVEANIPLALVEKK